MSTLVTTFHGAVRRPRLSYYGNPTYDVITSHGTFRTQTDASLSYSIPNYTNTRLDACLIGRPVKLTLTRSQRVTNIERAD